MLKLFNFKFISFQFNTILVFVSKEKLCFVQNLLYFKNKIKTYKIVLKSYFCEKKKVCCCEIEANLTYIYVNYLKKQ